MSQTIRVTKKAMLTAAEWLDFYDDDGSDEKRDCQSIAAFLRRTVETAEREAAVRRVAKEANCTTKQARAALNKVPDIILAGHYVDIPLITDIPVVPNA